MDNNTLAAELLALGFKEGERDKNGFCADLGTPVQGLWYLQRVFGGQYQYVSLCSYEGKFLEAVVQVHEKVFNSRAKVQPKPWFVALPRTREELLPMLDKVYPNPEEKVS